MIFFLFAQDSITISYVNISELRVEDGGVYRCVADNNFAKVQYERSIQVRGDPIIRSMPNVTVIQGETFVKHCPVSGFPIDEIIWYQGKFFFFVIVDNFGTKILDQMKNILI